MESIKKIILVMALLVAIAHISSCSQIPIQQELKSDVFYKRDMIITINGQSFEGTTVVPKAKKYSYHVQSRGELNMFTFQTCHREWTKESAWNVVKVKRRLFWKKKIDVKNQVKFDYVPTALERSYCPVSLGGYEKSLGRHSWGFIDHKTDLEKLPGKVNCNGSEYKSSGVTVCQARNGLIQLISFNDNVKVYSMGSCSLGASEGKIFKYKMPKGRCVFLFQTKTGEKHRLTTLGYEKILIRQ